MNYCFAGKKESKRNVNPMDPFTSLSFCKSVLLAYVKGSEWLSICLLLVIPDGY